MIAYGKNVFWDSVCNMMNTDAAIGREAATPKWLHSPAPFLGTWPEAVVISESTKSTVASCK